MQTYLTAIGSLSFNYKMENQKQKALVVKAFGTVPVYEDFQIPQPKANQVLIKVIASTINPSDRASVRGGYRQTSVPFVAGLEGYGQVIKAGSEENHKFLGLKVSFTTVSGAWAHYTVANVDNIWEVQSDVPVECAASGIVNPLTVVGIVDTYQKWNFHGAKGKGLINTAAASALGRMLNKYCQRQNIPLLNIVRRKEQVKLLEQQGAKFILDTSNQNWIDQFNEYVKVNGFNVLFDAIGGGQVTDKLISSLQPGSQIYVYGKLTNEPFTIRKPLVAFQGTSISNFMLFEWYSRISSSEKDNFRNQFSSLLKNELATTSLKQVKLQDIPAQWAEAQKRATEGKYTIMI